VKHTADQWASLPPRPPYAAGAFGGERVEGLIRRYADLLATDGVVRGLIGPREVPRLWDRHLLNCAPLVELTPQDARVCDLGSGAGLPGLVLAIARPDLGVTLVEPLLRRTTFLDEAVGVMELDNVTVFRGRAESLHGVQEFDVVTARALAPLSQLIAWSMPLVSQDGVLLAMKGASAPDEVRDAEQTLAEFGCSAPEVLSLTQADGVSTTTVVRVSWSGTRRVSLPSTPAKSSSRSTLGRSSARSQDKRRRRKSDKPFRG
jgi:16S rRNA (guanine527-N7)-methyltransferase